MYVDIIYIYIDNKFMCMIYKGVTYHYAFELKIPVDYSNFDKILNIVISNYREDTQDFAGLCLENEHKVISKEKMIFMAFFDIINQIVDGVIEGNRAYMKTQPEQLQFPVPLMFVQAPVFLEQFEKCKKSKKSLDWYEKLKDFFERPETITEKVLNETPETVLFDCQNLSFFSNLIQANALPVKNVGFFRI